MSFASQSAFPGSATVNNTGFSKVTRGLQCYYSLVTMFCELPWTAARLSVSRVVVVLNENVGIDMWL